MTVIVIWHYLNNIELKVELNFFFCYLSPAQEIYNASEFLETNFRLYVKNNYLFTLNSIVVVGCSFRLSCTNTGDAVEVEVSGKPGSPGVHLPVLLAYFLFKKEKKQT